MILAVGFLPRSQNQDLRHLALWRFQAALRGRSHFWQVSQDCTAPALQSLSDGSGRPGMKISGAGPGSMEALNWTLSPSPRCRLVSPEMGQARDHARNGRLGMHELPQIFVADIKRRKFPYGIHKGGQWRRLPFILSGAAESPRPNCGQRSIGTSHLHSCCVLTFGSAVRSPRRSAMSRFTLKWSSGA
jgi:hypothetical protein